MSQLPPAYDDLLQARMRKPFVPFTIVMQDGRRFEITERLQTGFNEFTIIVNEGYTIHRLRMKELACVEVHEPAN